MATLCDHGDKYDSHVEQGLLDKVYDSSAPKDQLKDVDGEEGINLIALLVIFPFPLLWVRRNEAKATLISIL